MVTEVIAAQPLKYWGLEISALTSNNSDLSSGPWRFSADWSNSRSATEGAALTSNNSDVSSGPGRF